MKRILTIFILFAFACNSHKTEFKEFYSNGALKTKGSKRNGVFCDSIFTYHPSGHIASKGFIEKGEMHGEWIIYYDNGNIQSINKYKHGKVVSINAWGPNGMHQVIDGEGVVILYHENGVIKAQQEFHDNKMDGPTIEYDSLGNEISRVIFEKGKLKLPN